jgi:glycosyltransferase involved in cell wall biosynthesis
MRDQPGEHSPPPPPVARVAILYPSDPLGHVPGGIDSFVRGILQRSPPDLRYTLLGASSDPSTRPLRQPIPIGPNGNVFIPLVSMDARARRGLLPLSLRYTIALEIAKRRGMLAKFDILDFHRPEPAIFFRTDHRPKNLLLHTDMGAIRLGKTDFLWRHFPALYDSLERRLLPSFPRIYCVNRAAMARYGVEFPQLKDKLRFTNTWVDVDKFTPIHDEDERARKRLERLAKLNLPSNGPLLVFVGRLDSSKDPLLLLEALVDLLRTDPDAHLAMIGDGNLRSDVERRCSAADLRGRVSLLGPREAEFIADLNQVADAFCLSSVYEGMPIAALEATACGLPIASTRVGELPSLVVRNRTGALAEHRSPEAIATAIRHCLGIPRAVILRETGKALAPYLPNQVLSQFFTAHREQAQGRP